MMELGIDEVTLVAFPPPDRLNDPGLESWEDLAREMADEVSDAAGLYGAFGRDVGPVAAPKGYTVSHTLGHTGLYFAIAYHPFRPNMGVVLKFSASALHYLVEKIGLQLHDILKNAWKPDLYTLRSSRIDLTADFIDEGLSVDEIARSVESEDLLVLRQQRDKDTGKLSLRRAVAKTETIAKEGIVQTMYLGSRKANVNALFRMYDKRTEQIECKGPALPKAMGCEDWTRFEASLRHRYAAQFAGELISCADDADQAALIASVFDTRYRFVDADGGGMTPWSAALYDAAQGQGPVLSSSSWRNNDLAGRLAYIAAGSGLYPLLWQVDHIWPGGASKVVSWLLGDMRGNYVPNDDAYRWWMRNIAPYLKDYPTVDKWLAEAARCMAR